MKIKQNKAITLIALIITIIILLILAGVTIATLTGENGILNQTESAKEKNEKGEVVEKIKMALMISRTNMNNIAEIDTTILENELKKELGEDITIYKNGDNEFLPWYVVKNDYGYDILEDTTVNAKEGHAILDVTSISLENLVAIPGSISKLKITTVPVSKIENLIFTSSNTNAITVDNKGNVIVAESAKGGTTAKITVTGEKSTDVSATCTVTVKDVITNISVDDIQIEVNEIRRLAINSTPTLGTNTEEVKFSQSEESKSIVTVLDNGDVIGLTKGQAEITIEGKLSGKETKCNVSVIDATTQATLVSQIDASDYGKDINYIATVEGTQISNWKIFYNDGTNVYIILSDVYGGKLNSSLTRNLRIIGSTVCAKPANSNLQLGYFRSGLGDLNGWKEFSNGVSGAWAHGAPTIDMYQSSYNASHSGDDGISLYEDLYVCTKKYWLNSPSDVYSSRAWIVNADGTTGDENTSNYLNVRPIVCLPGTLTGTVGDTVELKRINNQE